MTPEERALEAKIAELRKEPAEAKLTNAKELVAFES